MPVEDTKLALQALIKKWPEYDRLYAYYEGEVVLKFSTKKLQNAFEKIGVFFAQNWLAVVIDAVLDRLSLKGFTVAGNKELTDVLALLFKEQQIALAADDIHQAAGITGEAFYIVGKVDNIIEAYFNDPAMTVMFYEDDNPKKKKFAAKLYESERHWHLILYYPATIERYQANKPKKDNLTMMLGLTFTPDAEKASVPNPYGKIPVFHFKNSQQGKREIDMGKAELSMQDAINILFSNMMVASEFNSMKQRYIISQADPGDLQNKAGEIWWVPAGDGVGEGTKLGEFEAADLAHFLTPMEKIAQALGIITRTPKHYFFSTGSDPSGEALMTMEAPLVKKTKRRLANYDVTWIEIAGFFLMLLGKEVKPTDITSQWESPASVQPLTEAQIIKTEKEATIPLKTSVRRRGWTQEEIEQMDKDKKEEQQQTSLALAELNALRTAESQDNTQPDGTE